MRLADPRGFAERVDGVSSAACQRLREWSTGEPSVAAIGVVRRAVKRRFRAEAGVGPEDAPRDLVFRSWNALERFEQDLAGDVTEALAESLAGRPMLEMIALELPGAIREALHVEVSAVNPGAPSALPVVPPSARRPAPWHHRKTGQVHGFEARGHPRGAY